MEGRKIKSQMTNEASAERCSHQLCLARRKNTKSEMAQLAQMAQMAQITKLQNNREKFRKKRNYWYFKLGERGTGAISRCSETGTRPRCPPVTLSLRHLLHTKSPWEFSINMFQGHQIVLSWKASRW